MDLLLQILALALLLGGAGLGYRYWIRPRAVQLEWRSLGLLVLVLLTCVGGLLGGLFWWFNAAQAFAWTLPPLAGRMLAAAGWSFAAMCWLTLRRPTPGRLRLILWLLAVYLAPLVAAIFLFHLQRFNFADPITYGFFGIAGGMTVATAWYLLRPPPLPFAPDVEATTLATRAWLGVVALVAGAWGLALFAADSGPSGLVWAWPGDLLTSRLIGVMLLAIAVGCLVSLRYRRVATVMLAGILVYGLGLAVAGVWNAFAGKPVPVGYVAVFGVIALGSAVALWRTRTAPARA